MRDQSLAIPQMPVAARPPPSLPKLAILQIPGRMIATGPQNSGAWLDGLITAITTVRDASDLSAFPYVSFAANLVLRILQAIQSVRKNQDDFRELAQNLVQIITSVQDTLRTYCKDCRPPYLFVMQCQLFADSLLTLLSRIIGFARDSQSWTRYFKATAIHNTIGQYRKQFDDMRANFTLTTIMHLSLKVLSEQNTRQLGYTWEYSEPVRLIDAMNVTVNLPLDLCSTPNDFADLATFLFRKRRGRSYVERGQYALAVGDKELQRNDKKLWCDHVQPGQLITMNILVRKSGTKAEEQPCPSCSYQSVDTDASRRCEITCSSCTTIFRVSQSGEDINSFAPWDCHSQRERSDDSDDHDVKYFRRYHVVLENPVRQNHLNTPVIIPWMTYLSDEFDDNYLEGTDFQRGFNQYLNPGNLLDIIVESPAPDPSYCDTR